MSELNTSVKPRTKIGSYILKAVFFLSALFSIFAVILICVFLFANGIPAMAEIGFKSFLLGSEWKPLQNIYGILPMIAGSIYVTAGALILGVPTGLLTAVFLARSIGRRLNERA